MRLLNITYLHAKNKHAICQFALHFIQSSHAKYLKLYKKKHYLLT